MSIAARLLGAPWDYASVRRIEEKSGERFEFVEGQVFAMSGASDAHIDLVAELVFQLKAQLPRMGPCKVRANDASVRVSDRDEYRYPDVGVYCDPKKGGPDGRLHLNPTVLVEVLSPSTREVDLGAKLEEYLAIPSLETYIVIEQEARQVTFHTRTPTGWQAQSFTEGTPEVPGIPARLDVDRLYEVIPL